MNKKYAVVYRFKDDPKDYRKEFDDFIDAIKYQGEILLKYKNSKKKPLEYCGYENM